MRTAASLLVTIIIAITIAQSGASAVFFRLTDKMPILLAVLLAAVFVRLARGMPPIPHEKISIEKAIGATKAFRALINAYVQTFIVFLVAIFLNLAIATGTSAELEKIPYKILETLLAIVDLLAVYSLFYMVKSDVSLAKVQADLIDEVINQGSSQRALDTVENVKKAFRGAGEKGEK